MNPISSTYSSKIALTDVRVFDGRENTAPTTVVIEGSVIGTDPTGAEFVDAGGAILLPGLIDAHIHLRGPESLDQLAAFGVTTALDMATWPAEDLAALRKESGTTDIRSAGTPIVGAGGMHAKLSGLAAAIITESGQADRMVADRAFAGSDYVKIMLEAPGAGGPDRAAAEAVVEAAHARGLRVVAHASSRGAYGIALDVGVDVVTHVPMDAELSADDVRRMLEQGCIAIPTLTMMEGLATNADIPRVFDRCLATVGALHAAGVPILAGSDANAQRGVPFNPEFGTALHRELELLVTAGLTPVDALHAATTLPASHFRLPDRGVIEPGARADLVLVDGNPLTDISATRAISRVWCAGVEQPRSPD
ncbi:amidohydrolase family protein [Nocardia australiensis]|uniref:amidohydrolase family protein n=1 Tax=Nocardia australiensis TaxID=2887191 RepID=UPI001D15337C|nr:amidohydrolase family protein [Nocardia australiensis]